MAARALWVTPARLSGAQRSYERVAARLDRTATVVLTGLYVWQQHPGTRYDVTVEVDALARTATEHGFSRFHVFGFSAGATVALAAALALGEAIESVTVFEPATIGDDDWSPLEAQWRRDIESVRHAPVDQRDARFAALMLDPGRSPEPAAGAAQPGGWDDRRDRLEDMIAAVGFTSGELAAVWQPCLVVTGGRSHPRFAALADRLLGVLPGAELAVFPDRSHLSPPMREEPDAFADLLRRFWAHPGRLV